MLEPAMPKLVRLGGSHAQRELWEDTLIVACLRGRYGGKAAQLISDRLDRRAFRTRRRLVARGSAGSIEALAEPGSDYLGLQNFMHIGYSCESAPRDDPCRLFVRRHLRCRSASEPSPIQSHTACRSRSTHLKAMPWPGRSGATALPSRIVSGSSM